MLVMVRGLVPVVAGAALAAVLTGCSGGADRESRTGASQSARTNAHAVLKAAVKKTAAQSSYRTVQTGEGASDRSEMLYQRKPAATVIKSWGRGTEENPSGFNHTVLLGGSIYVKSDRVPGKSWYTMDLGDSGEQPADPGDSRAAGYITEYAGALGATKSTEWIAEEKVGGRTADHYRGTVVIDELAGYNGPAMDKDVRDGYVELARKNGQTKVVIDMWVGKDDLVLRSRESDGKGKVLLTEEYSDFGAVPAITAPPTKTVATWDEFISGAAKR
ncbi:hypothetical protein [Streptomyces sp. NPDC049887]|uniref:hypothetical protein n=1 Tax=unclassified Streptomyces TaxID=2593676 RepID=UPI00343AAEC5